MVAGAASIYLPYMIGVKITITLYMLIFDSHLIKGPDCLTFWLDTLLLFIPRMQ